MDNYTWMKNFGKERFIKTLTRFTADIARDIIRDGYDKDMQADDAFVGHIEMIVRSWLDMNVGMESQNRFIDGGYWSDDHYGHLGDGISLVHEKGSRYRQYAVSPHPAMNITVWALSEDDAADIAGHIISDVFSIKISDNGG